jgi:ABC-type iron transport system FetAB ATPase subunit
MGQKQGGVRVRTLRLGKAILLFDGARSALEWNARKTGTTVTSYRHDKQRK